MKFFPVNVLQQLRLTALSLMLLGAGANAEDIDLFTGVNPAGGNVPTVMLYMHNTRNSNASVTHGCTYNDGGGAPALGDTVGGMEQCAMVNALLSIKQNPALLGRLKVGLMAFNNSQNFSNFDNGTTDIGNGNGECGYLTYVPTLVDEAGIDKLVASIKSYSDNNYLVPKRAVGDGMASAWAMLNGLQDNCANIDYSSLGSVATDCRDAVIVYIGNLTKTTAKAEDAPSGKGRVDTLLQSQLTSAFGYAATSDEYKLFTSPIAVTGLNDTGLYQADDWARFMKRVNVDDSTQNDRNITTYTIGVYDPALQSKLFDQFNFLGSMATQGGGKPFTVKASEASGFEDILIQIFTEVQAVNSVFSSATLPVSANTQGTFLNQVYIAMFRPDAQAGPRWFGNVKQYQLGFDSAGNIALADATQDPSGTIVSATNPNTGAISDAAISFWTSNTPAGQSDWPTAADEGYGFWVNDPNGDGLTFDAPDGDLVEKGGAAQMARVDYLTSQAARKVYSCAPGKCDTDGLIAFNKTNFSANGDTWFGLSASAGGGTKVTAGSINNLVVDYTCNNLETNKNKPARISCGFTVTSGVLPNLTLSSGKGKNSVVGDKVAIVDRNLLIGDVGTLGQTDCDQPNSPTNEFCELTNSSADSFTLQLNSMADGASGSAEITLYVSSRTAYVEQSAHGYAAGEEIELQSCVKDSNEAIDFNLNQIATGTGVYLTEVDTVLTSDTYTVQLESLALGSHEISCSNSTASLTADNLIDWIRGEDNAGNESSIGPCPLKSDGTRTYNDGSACSISIRPSSHGDVLHSRPAVINYGDIDNDNGNNESDVVVFYGSNDGLFRAINGNQTRSINGVRPGGELWSFVAPEFFTKFKRLYNDDPRINYTGIADPNAIPRDYFFDGTTTSLLDDRPYDAATTPTGGKRYVFLSARRGGNIIYALDVTTPTSPQFLWSVSDADLPELGQTWSQPKVTQVDGYDYPVLVFGAGYDTAEDSDPAPAVTDIDEGRGIVVLDVRNGDLVWGAFPSCTGVTVPSGAACVENSSLNRPIAADIALFDNNFDGKTDRLYAADMGGNIWRVDLEPGGNKAPANWALTQFASLGGTGNNARKFLFPPDVIPTKDYDIVVGVTGDREKPLYTDNNTPGLAYNVDNRFYLIVDKNGGDSVPAGNAVITESDLLDRTAFNCIDASNQPIDCSYDETDDRYEDSSGNEVTLVTLTEITSDFSGFYITLEGGTIDGDSEGEKGVNAPLAVAGKVYFGTNQPDIPTPGACSAKLGVARAYSVDIFNATATSKIFSGGGMPPSPIAGLVTIDGETVPFIIGGEGPTPFDPSTPVIDASGSRQRTYWFYK
ncbi:pilus assembly protein [Litorivivens sp.]|uniref:pilus assembly protein n=1 Tax=Litorivivens sp. TaxID=2020868 RepID=UPI0035695C47